MDCAFFAETQHCLSEELGNCGSMLRSDNKNVIFKKILCNMKKFNLEEAKAGKPVCTRDGKKARILCFDYKSNQFKIVAAISLDENTEYIETFTIDGKRDKSSDISELDLVMVSEKKNGWINVYHDRDYNNKVFVTSTPYSTKEEAIKASEDVLSSNLNFAYIGAFPFGWEE